MKTTGEFTIHRFVIPCKYNRPIKIVPFGDIHRLAPLHAEKVWFKFIERYKNDKDAYFIGMGDYLDEISTSERKGHLNANYHDSTIQNLDKIYVERALGFAREISFMEGRIIGLCEGNHYYKLESGQTTTNIIAQCLNTRCLGVKTFIELILKTKGNASYKVIICCHHGEGGGRRVSTSVAKLENMAYTTDADIILQGHDHKKNHIEVVELGLTHAQNGMPNLIQRTKFCARTGGFLKGYVDNLRSYIADANLPPNALGNVEFNVIIKRVRNNIPILGKSSHRNKTIEKCWVNIEFHSCNYGES